MGERRNFFQSRNAYPSLRWRGAFIGGDHSDGISGSVPDFFCKVITDGGETVPSPVRGHGFWTANDPFAVLRTWRHCRADVLLRLQRRGPWNKEHPNLGISRVRDGFL